MLRKNNVLIYIGIRIKVLIEWKSSVVITQCTDRFITLANYSRFVVRRQEKVIFDFRVSGIRIAARRLINKKVFNIKLKAIGQIR